MLGIVPYTALLLDLDHTLLDSDASESLAFERALASAGVADPGRYLPAYGQINRALWARVERGELTADQVRIVNHGQTAL
jgi:FMN phosphatase YigB (HAD superfamily)